MTAAPALPITLDLTSPEQTACLATILGRMLGAGDVLLLGGSIGAGKTHFARALIQSRLAAEGLAEDVPSPTFTLVQTYIAGALEIWHADLYRLTSPDEVLELGLDEAFETALCLIEWPDRLADLAPGGALALDFAATGDEGHRILTLSGEGWADRLTPAIAEFNRDCT